MIDPRALQQHFRKVQQRQEPNIVSVPRIPDPKPLTAIEAISVPEPIIEQEEIIVPVPEIIDLKEKVNLVIDVPPPIGDITIEEIEIEEEQSVPKEVLEQKENTEKGEPKTENPYGYSVSDREEDYNPYGYYSGPRF